MGETKLKRQSIGTDMPRVCARRSTNLALNSGGNTLTWNTEVYDTSNFFTPNGSVFTVPETGLYLITICIHFTSPMTNIRNFVTVAIGNGGTQSPTDFRLQDVDSFTGGDPSRPVETFQVYLQAGATISFDLWIASTGFSIMGHTGNNNASSKVFITKIAN